MKHSILWWAVALLIGVPLFLIVIARIIMVTIYVLPLILLGAAIFGVFKYALPKLR